MVELNNLPTLKGNVIKLFETTTQIFECFFNTHFTAQRTNRNEPLSFSAERQTVPLFFRQRHSSESAGAMLSVAFTISISCLLWASQKQGFIEGNQGFSQAPKEGPTKTAGWCYQGGRLTGHITLVIESWTFHLHTAGETNLAHRAVL